MSNIKLTFIFKQFLKL